MSQEDYFSEQSQHVATCWIQNTIYFNLLQKLKVYIEGQGHGKVKGQVMNGISQTLPFPGYSIMLQFISVTHSGEEGGDTSIMAWGIQHRLHPYLT